MTKQQRAALDTLKAMHPFVVVPAHEIIARHSRRRIEVPATIHTGINTATLYNLREAGYITCATVWLRGHTTPDLAITPKGWAA